MHASAFVALGLTVVASVANGAPLPTGSDGENYFAQTVDENVMPTPLVDSAELSGVLPTPLVDPEFSFESFRVATQTEKEITMTHTVEVEEALPTPSMDETLTPYPSEASDSASYDETGDAAAATVTAAAAAAAPPTADEPADQHAEAAAAPPAPTTGSDPEEADAAQVPEESQLSDAVSNNSTEHIPVVPVRICTNNGDNCLTTFGSEFANAKLSWDNVASFSLGMTDGLLVRLDDLKCVNAVPMDDNEWYDLEFTSNCVLPAYLKGAVEFEGNGIADDIDKLPVKHTNHTSTVWFYNETTEELCANVNDGLNDIAEVCMYSSEGYAALATKDEFKKDSVAARDRKITMPLVKSDQSVAEQLLMMLKAMTYDGEVFWAEAWDTNIVGVMKYRMFNNNNEEEVDMTRDEVNGVIYPLWQVINECRELCDCYEWCHSFTFPINERVCRLSDRIPHLKGEEIDAKNPDTVTFVQNKNYNRTDYILQEDLKKCAANLKA